MVQLFFEIKETHYGEEGIKASQVGRCECPSAGNCIVYRGQARTTAVDDINRETTPEIRTDEERKSDLENSVYHRLTGRSKSFRVSTASMKINVRRRRRLSRHQFQLFVILIRSGGALTFVTLHTRLTLLPPAIRFLIPCFVQPAGRRRTIF